MVPRHLVLGSGGDILVDDWLREGPLPPPFPRLFRVVSNKDSLVKESYVKEGLCIHLRSWS